MSYLLDNRKKKRRTAATHIAVGALIVGALLLLYPFSFSGNPELSDLGALAFRAEKDVASRFFSPLALFSSKKRLLAENEDLAALNRALHARLLADSLARRENEELKALLGRTGEGEHVLASILSKPNRTPYDTVIIDAGTDAGVEEGALVLAHGEIAIGRVGEASEKSAKVILFSTSGVVTEALVVGEAELSIDLSGRGGGDFEASFPRDTVVSEGAIAVLPGIDRYPVAVAGRTLSDPRDPFEKILFLAPFNIQEIGSVLVEVSR